MNEPRRPDSPEAPRATGRDRRVARATAVFLAVAIGFAGLTLIAWRDELTRTLREAGGFAWQPDLAWLSLALICAILALWLTGTVWARLYRATGTRLSYAEATAAWIGSNLGRYIPGKIWQLSGLAAYVKARGHQGALAVATSVVLQAVTLLSAIVWALATLGPDLLGTEGGAGVSLLILAGLLLILVQPPVVRIATRLGARLLREEPREAPASSADTLQAAFLMALAWWLYGIGLWALLLGVAGEAPLSPLAATGAFAAAYTAGYLVLVAPGGLVVREGALAGLLVALTAWPAAVAAILALAARVWVTAAELVALAVAALIRTRSRSRG